MVRGGCNTPPTCKSGIVPKGYKLPRLLVNVLLRPFMEVVSIFGESLQDLLFGLLGVALISELVGVFCVQQMTYNRHSEAIHGISRK